MGCVNFSQNVIVYPQVMLCKKATNPTWLKEKSFIEIILQKQLWDYFNVYCLLCLHAKMQLVLSDSNHWKLFNAMHNPLVIMEETGPEPIAWSQHKGSQKNSIPLIAKLSPKPQLQLGAKLVLFPAYPTTHPPKWV